jgi:SulP family sulfate permease
MDAVPADFLDKWRTYFDHITSVNVASTAIAILTVTIIFLWPKITHKIPGSLVAIFVTSFVMQYFHLPVETIGSRFGNISSSPPAPTFPAMDYATLKALIQPVFTIALLGGIESLLSAVVADGMIRGNHKSNIELVAQVTAKYIFRVIWWNSSNRCYCQHCHQY